MPFRKRAMISLPQQVLDCLRRVKHVVVLTGAGVSAESGIREIAGSCNKPLGAARRNTPVITSDSLIFSDFLDLWLRP